MLSIQKDVSLKNYSNYKIGGPAKYLLKISNIDELIKGLEEWEKIQQKDSSSKPALPRQGGVFILGQGTNVLISDKGFEGLVIHNKIKDIKILRHKDTESQRVRESDLPAGRQGVRVRVGAGVLMEDLLNFCIQNCLSGLEWAGGLPGTLGGAIRGNAGAFGGEVKDNITEVESLNTQTLEIKKRINKDCDFDYRTSIFKIGEGEKDIIISAVLKLKNGDKNLIKKNIEEKIKYRKNRHPLKYPNIGSIFKNIPIGKVPQKLLEQLKGSIKNDPFPILPTAKLLALAGLKGKQAGGAMVSRKHPNFIVNLGRAKSQDVQKLIKEIKKIIKNKYGVELEEEITII